MKPENEPQDPSGTNLDAKIERDLHKADLQRTRASILRHLQSKPDYEKLYNNAQERFKSTVKGSQDVDAAYLANNIPGMREHLREKGLTEAHLKILDDMYKKAARRPKARQFGEVGAAILRGKLGVDNLFLAFGITGMFLLPCYFYWKRQRHQKEITKLRTTYEGADKSHPPDIDDTSFDFYAFDREKERQRVLRGAPPPPHPLRQVGFSQAGQDPAARSPK